MKSLKKTLEGDIQTALKITEASKTSLSKCLMSNLTLMARVVGRHYVDVISETYALM